MLLVATALLQFSAILSTLALPTSIPAPTAAGVGDSAAGEPKASSTELNGGMSATLTPDVRPAHSEKNPASTIESNATASLSPEPLNSAQNLRALSAIRIPAIDPAKQNGIIRAERAPSRRSWLALSLIQHGAAAFDAYSTREAISRGAVEIDPTMRPFAHSPGLYAAIQMGPVMLDLISRRMQRSQIGFVRHLWWLPQSVSTASFIYSGVHNLGVVGHP